VVFSEKQVTTLEEVIDHLEGLFLTYAIDFQRDAHSVHFIESEGNDGSGIKSFKSFRKEGTQLLTEIHLLLAK
jgi:hypothetical protein